MNLAEIIRRRRGLTDTAGMGDSLPQDMGGTPPPAAPPEAVMAQMSPEEGVQAVEMLAARQKDNARKLAMPADFAPDGPTEPMSPPPPPPQVPPEQRMAPQGDDGGELRAAHEADRKSRLTAGMELAARQLVGGITRTDVGQGVGANPSRVPEAQEAAKTRRQQVLDAIDRQRKGRLEDSTVALQQSEVAKNMRPPPEKGPQVDYTETKKGELEARRLAMEETARHNKVVEALQAKRGVKGPGSMNSDQIAQATADGQLAPPSPRQKNYDEVMGKILKIKPDYDATKFAAYQHARTEQSTNANINAAKAVTHHMELLRKAVDELPEGMIDSPGTNKLAQRVAGATGSDKYTAMKTEASVVAAELAQALGEKDVEGRAMVQHLVDPTQTKAQWAKSLPALEQLRDEKLGTYRETLAGLAPAPKTPAKAETKTVSGVTYEKRADGKWHPVGN